jgi:RimJ/RimL family protein N-acetyltransferase
LRPLEREDAPAIIGWLNDPEVTRTLLWHRPINLAAEEAFIESAYARDRTDLLLGIALVESDELIGSCGLREVDARARHASFGIVIGAKERWGQGLGSEAVRLIVEVGFARLNLNRIWLLVHEDNERGIRAYERAGFRREGLLREHAFREGRYVNEVLMGILREEWERARS